MKKVLMVEDEPDILEFFASAIPDRLSGYAFFGADSGDLALEIAQKDIPDLIILDLKLGKGPQGPVLLRRLKTLAPEARTIILTGYIDPNLETEIRNLGVYAYLEKPTGVDELLHLIQEAIPSI